jgi:hypothetical protein
VPDAHLSRSLLFAYSADRPGQTIDEVLDPTIILPLFAGRVIGLVVVEYLFAARRRRDLFGTDEHESCFCTTNSLLELAFHSKTTIPRLGHSKFK